MKRSLSNNFTNKEPDILNIDIFHGETIISHKKRASETGSQKDHTAPPREDPSVCSWDFPLMENCRETADNKEDYNEKIARIEKESYEKGFAQGQKDGLALEQKKVEEMGKQLESLFSEIRDLKPIIYSESEEELTKLGMLIAKKIVKEEIKTNGDIIIKTIQSAMEFLVDKRKVKIILNPDDMESVKSLLPDMAKIARGGKLQLTEDHSITKGGCFLETGFGKINATIEDQLELLENEIAQQFMSNQGEAV